MAYYNTCPDCGANLDPGEKCECNGKGLPRSNGNSPSKNGSSTIVAQNSEDVKTEPLRVQGRSQAYVPRDLPFGRCGIFRSRQARSRGRI